MKWVSDAREIKGGQLEKTLSLAVSFIAALSGFAVAASVVYDFGYFSAINLNLMLFASLQDHVANALIWLPIGLLVFFFCYPFSFELGRFHAQRDIAAGR
jgi:hypothetical protein